MKHFITFLLIVGLLAHAFPVWADILITGEVVPSAVTTGFIAEPLVIGSEVGAGTVTVNGGSTLTVDNPSASTGIILSTANPSSLTITQSANVTSSAFNALRVFGDSVVDVNGGSQLALNGIRVVGTSDNGRGLLIGDSTQSGTVNVDGAGTSVEIVGRLTIAGTGSPGAVSGNGLLTVTNGASISHSSTTTSLLTSFIVGSNDGNAQLILASGSQLTSQVPGARIGTTGFVSGTGLLDISGSSILQLTSALFVGEFGALGVINVTDSTLRILADSATPVPETGSVFVGVGSPGFEDSHADVVVVGGNLEIDRSLFVATGDPSVIGNVTFNVNSTGTFGDGLFISHDGIVNTGQGTGLVQVCDSVVVVPEVLIGENGTLAGGGPSGVANITGNVTLDGGSIAPGCSPGELTIDGDVTFVDGELIVEVFGASSFDVLTALGNVDFQAGTVRFTFTNGYGPAANDSFTFLNANLVSGTENVSFEYDGLLDDFAFDITANGPDLQFVALNDGVPDGDNDGVADDEDNCKVVANPMQLDTDGDSIGNLCDADITGDCIVNFADLAALKAGFFPVNNPDADFTGDGLVNFGDLAFMKSTFFNSASPGPGPGTPGNDCE